ncbi:DNA translocase FtsK 4TM domain-containing protein [Novispirillum itersonii]|uniref:DNA translocase FtsK n=1 Tax=Novispirillum itersonii TaxID=189 RepID=A0A7W9ZE66_NOVIT|nr:S-DNA-T family DNA segregation ATPase FtsK/SpoIIIE [Novispirillum itersonii]
MPPEAKEALIRLCRRLIGLALILLSGVLAVALWAYSPSDPSLNTAGPKQVDNLLGLPGAVAADALFQGFGLLALAPLALLIFWGFRLLLASPVRWIWLRLVVLVIAMILASATALLFSPPAFWIAPVGLGGVSGTMLINTLRLVVRDHGLSPSLIPLAQIGAGALGLVLYLWVAMLRWREWRAIGRLFGLIHVRRPEQDWDRHPAEETAPEAYGAEDSDASGPEPERGAEHRHWRVGRKLMETLRRGDAGAEGVERRDPILSATDTGLTDPAPLAQGEEGQTPAAPVGPAQGPTQGKTPRTAKGTEKSTPRRETSETEPPRPEPVITAPPPPAPARPASRKELAARQSSLLPEEGGVPFRLPPLDLLQPLKGTGISAFNEDALTQNARLLEGVLDDFGVNGRIVEVRPGPVVTLYELEPAPGTKTSRVVGLADDIARSMSAISVRIAVVPGKSTIGIELPNGKREMVNFRGLLAAGEMPRQPGTLTLALGRDIGGTPVYVDLARMPHLLIAGTTGSGKSVAVNTMICSLLFRLSPADCRFIMIDPKMLELSVYDGIPHLLTPVVTDPGKAVVALKWAVKEMESRYRAMSQMGVRNIAGYNQKLRDSSAKGQTLTRLVQTGFDPETGKPEFEEQQLDMTPLPFIVVIVDEMADLMLVAGKDVEAAIQRLAQMARAAGIHLIMATQRPSVDVITGTIKANFPTRISFQVTSKIDSRTILGEQGAEQLLGQGDMLYMAAGGRISRVHGPFVSDQEVEDVASFLRDQGTPEYIEAVIDEEEQGGSSILDMLTGGGADDGAGGDALFDQAVALIARERKVSTSFIQRHLQIGYNRAARLVERMEKDGMISRANSAGKREVLLPPPQDGF